MECYNIAYSSVFARFGAWRPPHGEDGLSLAIGFFDGVHRGHAEVIREAVRIGLSRGLKPAVLTFDPHPRLVLGQDPERVRVLTPLEDKIRLLKELGVRLVYVIEFDRDFAGVPAERFVRELLLPMGVQTVVVGFDFRFGRGGAGDAETLRTAGDGRIDVRVVGPVVADGVKTGSSEIRERLEAGDCEGAARMLGRPYEIRGAVVGGDGRGRQIGFPTANLSLKHPYVLPRNGVYAVVAQVADKGPDRPLAGVMNVGVRPTFAGGDNAPRVEIHLFDFSGDLYGREMTVSLRHFLRPERQFASVDLLVEQIRQDATQARSLLRDTVAER
jgi:riboflavin kinase/FMN adenylyltransferase